MVNEILYKMICKTCWMEYIGESSRNAHSRSADHIKDSLAKTVKTDADGKIKSVIVRHCIEEHNGEIVEFAMEVVKSYQNDPTARQNGEAILIREMDPEKKINSKQEWRQPEDVLIQVKKNDHNKDDNDDKKKMRMNATNYKDEMAKQKEEAK